MNFLAAVPVLVAIYSGITFLAYKHPSGYLRLLRQLNKWFWPIFIVSLGFLIGKDDGLKAFVAVKDTDVAARAVAMQKDTHESLNILFLYFGGSWLYFWLLTYLPEITKDSQSKAGTQADGSSVKTDA